MKPASSKSCRMLKWLIALTLTGCLPSNTDNIGALVTLGLLEETTYILVPFVAQENEYSCGLACLVSVLAYWKDPVSQRELLRQTPPESKSTGYNVGELKAIAAGRNKQAFALTATPAFLEQQLGKGRPPIVTLEMEYNHYLFNFMRKIPIYGRFFTYMTDRFVPKFSHFVTVFAISKKTIWVMDPIFGVKPIPREEFTDMWDAKKRAMLLLAGV